MKTIGVKYCGGCNPEIQRTELVNSLTRLLAEDFRLDTGEASERWEVAILVCGCPVACLDRPDTRALAQNCVVIGGSIVDSRPVPREQLTTVIVEKLQRLLACSKGEPS
jgi:hypothetical protein